MRLDSVTVAAVTRGTALGPVVPFGGIVIDSREAAEGDLFVAIRGERLDGNDFVAAALAKAAGALVTRTFDIASLPEGRALVRVGDTLVALRALARYALETIRPRVLAVTGSVGKTTTKELLSGILSRRFRTVRTRGNLNNQYGLPLEVARMPEGTEAAVLEMGMSTPGEIRSLSELATPEVGLVTTVAPVHLQGFSSIDGIREAKAEILAGMGPTSTFVANADDPRVLGIAARHRGPVLTYGLGGSATALDASASGLAEEAGRSRFRLRLKGDEAEVVLPLPGRHNVLNFLGAAAAASVLGLSAADAAAAASAGALAPARHRGEIRELPGGVLLYDDCYNSSPVALRAAWAAFETAAGSRRRVAVLGEMRELGPTSRGFHEEAGREIGPEADLLVAVQGDAAAIAEGAKAVGSAGRGGRQVEFVPGAAEALALLRERLRPGDALFVKGSRGVGLDRVVDALSVPTGAEARP